MSVQSSLSVPWVREISIMYILFLIKFNLLKSFKIIFYKIKKIRIHLDDMMTSCVLEFFSKEYKSVIDKYLDFDDKELPIGNTIWVFWYTGFEDAPIIVKQCVKSISAMHEIELVLLDKDNFKDFVNISESILSKFNSGKINIQTLSDIIRVNLLKERGGVWLDATIFVINKDFIDDKKDYTFYSVRHKEKEACEHFSKGRLSTFLIGSGIGGSAVSFVSDIYDAFLYNHSRVFDYFFTDYILCLAYELIPSIRNQIDSLPLCNEDVFYLWHHYSDKYDINVWNNMVEKNEVQKIPWKLTENGIPFHSMLGHFISSLEL